MRVDNASGELIVVGPAEIWRDMVKSVDDHWRVVAFTSLDELDHWRQSQGLDDPSSYPDPAVGIPSAPGPIQGHRVRVAPFVLVVLMTLPAMAATSLFSHLSASRP